jgi:hypothetical protein
MPIQYTYLKKHGTPAELIDAGLSILEGWVDKQCQREATEAGAGDIYAILSRASLRDKIDLVTDGVDDLGNEYMERDMWQGILDMIELRPQMDSPDAHAILKDWLTERGWYDPQYTIDAAPEPLHAELQLRTDIDGTLIYLEGWLEGLADS